MADELDDLFINGEITLEEYRARRRAKLESPAAPAAPLPPAQPERMPQQLSPQLELRDLQAERMKRAVVENPTVPGAAEAAAQQTLEQFPLEKKPESYYEALKRAIAPQSVDMNVDRRERPSLYERASAALGNDLNVGIESTRSAAEPIVEMALGLGEMAVSPFSDTATLAGGAKTFGKGVLDIPAIPRGVLGAAGSGLDALLHAEQTAASAVDEFAATDAENQLVKPSFFTPFGPLAEPEAPIDGKVRVPVEGPVARGLRVVGGIGQAPIVKGEQMLVEGVAGKPIFQSRWTGEEDPWYDRAIMGVAETLQTGEGYRDLHVAEAKAMGLEKGSWGYEAFEAFGDLRDVLQPDLLVLAPPAMRAAEGVARQRELAAAGANPQAAAAGRRADPQGVGRAMENDARRAWDDGRSALDGYDPRMAEEVRRYAAVDGIDFDAVEAQARSGGLSPEGRAAADEAARVINEAWRAKTRSAFGSEQVRTVDVRGDTYVVTPHEAKAAVREVDRFIESATDGRLPTAKDAAKVAARQPIPLSPEGGARVADLIGEAEPVPALDANIMRRIAEQVTGDFFGDSASTRHALRQHNPFWSQMLKLVDREGVTGAMMSPAAWVLRRTTQAEPSGMPLGLQRQFTTILRNLEEVPHRLGQDLFTRLNQARRLEDGTPNGWDVLMDLIPAETRKAMAFATDLAELDTALTEWEATFKREPAKPGEPIPAPGKGVGFAGSTPKYTELYNPRERTKAQREAYAKKKRPAMAARKGKAAAVRKIERELEEVNRSLQEARQLAASASARAAADAAADLSRPGILPALVRAMERAQSDLVEAGIKLRAADEIAGTKVAEIIGDAQAAVDTWRKRVADAEEELAAARRELGEQQRLQAEMATAKLREAAERVTLMGENADVLQARVAEQEARVEKLRDQLKSTGASPDKPLPRRAEDTPKIKKMLGELEKAKTPASAPASGGTVKSQILKVDPSLKELLVELGTLKGKPKKTKKDSARIDEIEARYREAKEKVAAAPTEKPSVDEAKVKELEAAIEAERKALPIEEPDDPVSHIRANLAVAEAELGTMKARLEVVEARAGRQAAAPEPQARVINVEAAAAAVRIAEDKVGRYRGGYALATQALQRTMENAGLTSRQIQAQTAQNIAKHELDAARAQHAAELNRREQAMQEILQRTDWRTSRDARVDDILTKKAEKEAALAQTKMELDELEAKVADLEANEPDWESVFQAEQELTRAKKAGYITGQGQKGPIDKATLDEAVPDDAINPDPDQPHPSAQKYAVLAEMNGVRVRQLGKLARDIVVAFADPANVDDLEARILSGGHRRAAAIVAAFQKLPEDKGAALQKLLAQYGGNVKPSVGMVRLLVGWRTEALTSHAVERLIQQGMAIELGRKGPVDRGLRDAMVDLMTHGPKRSKLAFGEAALEPGVDILAGLNINDYRRAYAMLERLGIKLDDDIIAVADRAELPKKLYDQIKEAKGTGRVRSGQPKEAREKGAGEWAIDALETYNTLWKNSVMGAFVPLGLANIPFFLEQITSAPFFMMNELGAKGTAGAMGALVRHRHLIWEVIAKTTSRTFGWTGASVSQAHRVVTDPYGRVWNTDFFVDASENHGLDTSSSRADFGESVVLDADLAILGSTPWLSDLIPVIVDWRKGKFDAGKTRANWARFAAETRRVPKDQAVRAKVVGPVAWWAEQFWDIAHATESAFRLAVFIDRIENGIGVAQAAEHARNALLDYGAIPERERRVMRLIIPFYAYLRQNFLSYLHATLTNPARVSQQARLLRTMHDVDTEDEEVGLPDDRIATVPLPGPLGGKSTTTTKGFENSLGKVGIGDFVRQMQLLESVVTLTTEPTAARPFVMGDALVEGLGRSNPLIRGVAAGIGVDPRTGDPIRTETTAAANKPGALHQSVIDFMYATDPMMAGRLGYYPETDPTTGDRTYYIDSRLYRLAVEVAPTALVVRPTQRIYEVLGGYDEETGRGGLQSLLLAPPGRVETEEAAVTRAGNSWARSIRGQSTADEAVNRRRE